MKGERFKNYDDYGLQYLAAHLYERRSVPARRRALYRLICAPFMREKQRRTHSHRAFLQDVNLALATAGEERPPNLHQEIRCSLLAAMLGDLATVIPPELPGVLARAGREEQAIGLSELVQDPRQRCQAYLAVSEALIEKHNPARAVDVLERALAATRGKWRDPSRDSYESAESLAWSRGYRVDAYADESSKDMEPMWSPEDAVADIARLLARAGAFERAIQVARAIEKKYARGKACTAVFTALLQERALAQARALVASHEAPEQPDLHREFASFLAREGAINEALQIADSLEDGYWRAWALESVVEELLANKEVKLAWQVTRRIEDDDCYSRALTKVAMAEATHRPRVALGLLNDALSRGTGIDVTVQASLVYAALGKDKELTEMTSRAVQAVHNMWGWASIRAALKEMARALARVVSYAGADRARSMLWHLEDRRQMAWILGWTACELAQMEKPDLALDTAREALTMARAYKKENILRQVMEALAPALNQAQAHEFLGTADDVHDRVQLMIGCAEGWSRVGAHDRAAAMADEVLLLLESSGRGFRHDAALSPIALALAQLGEARHARCIVEELASDRERNRAREAVTRELAEAGGVDRADTGAEITASAACKAAQEGAAARAQSGVALADIFQEVDDLPTLGPILIESAVRRLAQALVGTGQFDQALDPLLQAIGRITYAEDRAQALANVAEALADDGETELAAKMAQRAFSIMPVKYHIYGRFDAPASVARRNMKETVYQVAHALARVGDVERALQALTYLESEMDRDDYRDDVLYAIVIGLVQGGRVDGALAETHRIQEVEKRVGALCDVAHTINLSKDSQRALDVWRMALHTARHAASDEVYDVIGRGAALLGAVDNGETLWKAYETIVALEGWWDRP